MLLSLWLATGCLPSGVVDGPDLAGHSSVVARQALSSDEDSAAIGLVDDDRDGYLSDVDCDDDDPDVYPGVPEVWNGVDDDCDGRADADGVYTGDLNVVIKIALDGRPRVLRLTCPASLGRSGSEADLEAGCLIDRAHWSSRYGRDWSVELEVRSEAVEGASWAGPGRLRGSRLGRPLIEADLDWTDLDTIEVDIRGRSEHLSLRGSGYLERSDL